MIIQTRYSNYSTVNAFERVGWSQCCVCGTRDCEHPANKGCFPRPLFNPVDGETQKFFIFKLSLSFDYFKYCKESSKLKPILNDSKLVVFGVSFDFTMISKIINLTLFISFWVPTPEKAYSYY